MNRISQSVFGRIIAVVTACALTSLTATVPAQAEPNDPQDFGVITALVVGVTAGITSGAVVHEITKEPAPSPNAPNVAAYGTTYVLLDNATTIEDEGYVKVYSRSIGQYLLPNDMPDILPLPASFVLAETGTVEGTAGHQLQLEFSDINEQANVLDPGLGVADKVSYEVRRQASGTWTRPGSAVGDGLMTIDINISDLFLGTTSAPQTVGNASYQLDIGSPELGLLFHASGIVREDGTLLVDGDIGLGAYEAVPGSGEASLSYATQLQIPVPEALSSTSLDIIFQTIGAGIRTEGGPVGIPTLPEWGLIILTISAFFGAVWTVVRRRKNWLPI